MSVYFSSSELQDLIHQVERGERLDLEAGIRLLKSNDLLALGYMANLVRERKNGNKTYFIVNHHIMYTNVNVNLSLSYAYGVKKEDDQAFTLTLKEIEKLVSDMAMDNFSEILIFGGLNTELPYEYYLDMLKCVKKILPHISLQAFTAVEIDYFTQITGYSVAQVLMELKHAGLDSLLGGEAEIFSLKVRSRIGEKKVSEERCLAIQDTAHRLDIRTNATMIYGHINTVEERIEHLLKLRELQDSTAGFLSCIPLPFYPEHTQMEGYLGVGNTTGFEDLKILAVSRILLDNFDHIKTFWMTLGHKLAQVSLAFGVDDLAGTVIETRMIHASGAENGQTMSKKALVDLIQKAGREAYSMLEARGSRREGRTIIEPRALRLAPREGMQADISSILERRLAGERLNVDEGVLLLEEAGLLELAQAAEMIKTQLHPHNAVTFVIDRNINYTNICTCKCKFCAFYCDEGQPEGYVLSREELFAKIEDTLALGGTQLLIQGGLHPVLSLQYFEEMLKDIKSRYTIHIHSFSPPEIWDLAQKSGLKLEEVLLRLKAAGLDSIPGGGAEILSDRVRHLISPNKINWQQWMEVMTTAHRLGMNTTATMMFGHVETLRERILHMVRIREAQDQTGGFTAFIPWSFAPKYTELGGEGSTGVDYLRTLAVARLMLDNVPNIQASWVTQGAKMAQVALRFGANDFGSTMLEENVVRAAGVQTRVPLEEIIHCIEDAGHIAVQRNTHYEWLKVYQKSGEK